MHQPEIDETRMKEMKDSCDSVPKGETKDKDVVLQQNLCNQLKSWSFQNTPRAESYTSHHWAGSWDGQHVNVMTKINISTFSVLSLKLN